MSGALKFEWNRAVEGRERHWVSKERKKPHRENILGENQLLGIVGMAATDAADRASTAATREVIGAETTAKGFVRLGNQMTAGGCAASPDVFSIGSGQHGLPTSKTRLLFKSAAGSKSVSSLRAASAAALL